MPTILGEHPLAKDADGKLKSRIATIFPQHNAIVTLPGIHATQRMAFVDLLDAERSRQGLTPLSLEERTDEWANAVDLIMEDNAILIRPDPDNMPLAFRADDLLQDLAPKQQVRFLYAVNQKVRGAIKRRGECWRITPLARSPEDMKRMLAASRIGIGGREIYYFNKATGTRFLTLDEFTRLGALGEDELRRYLAEIKTYSAKYNRLGCPEVSFFAADRSFGKALFAPLDFALLDPAALQAAYASLRQAFCQAVRAPLRRDDLENVEWRNALFAALMGQADQALPEETLLGLSSEFYMQVEWLPGARIEEGELIFDSVFEQSEGCFRSAEEQRQWMEKSRGFVFNLVREYGDLEYVNIGRVIGSLSMRPAYRGRRDVYIAEVKQRGGDREILKIIRMQKWGVRERLNEGKDLLTAILESESYTDYVLDRRLGCRQLGMNLPPRIAARRLQEMYYGRRGDEPARCIWSPYFERDYVYGIASDKLPSHRLENEEYALRLARLLGAAAAPNILVGRCDFGGRVVFDDGDEVVVENDQGLPVEIVVSDHTSTFNDYRQDLRRYAAEYAHPVNRRAQYVGKPQRFFDAYLDAFLARFSFIQEEYRRRKRAFDTLFKNQPKDPAGNFSFRWELVLDRLNRTDPKELQELIRRNLVG